MGGVVLCRNLKTHTTAPELTEVPSNETVREQEPTTVKRNSQGGDLSTS